MKGPLKSMKLLSTTQQGNISYGDMGHGHSLELTLSMTGGIGLSFLSDKDKQQLLHTPHPDRLR